MAISMIAASQHSVCPAMRACAFTLLGTSEIDGVVDAAANFGDILLTSGQQLCDSAIYNATAVSAIDTPAANQLKH